MKNKGKLGSSARTSSRSREVIAASADPPRTITRAERGGVGCPRKGTYTAGSSPGDDSVSCDRSGTVGETPTIVVQGTGALGAFRFVSRIRRPMGSPLGKNIVTKR